MKKLLSDIRDCTHCKAHLPMGPNPVLAATSNSKILIIGQAPGRKVHESGIPWDDASGKTLRKWLAVTDAEFYNPDIFGIVPMGFCYPGKGKTGDLPPRPECAELWHEKLMNSFTDVQLILLIGNYAQKHYLKDVKKKNLTETVGAYEEYLPLYFPMPHPSPTNRFWKAKNPWFEELVVPVLQQHVREAMV